MGYCKQGWCFAGTISGRQWSTSVNSTLVGVHSGAASCGSSKKKDLPAWWIRVATFYDWITCIKTKAEQGLAHDEVEKRGCRRQIKKSIIKPKCSHTKLLRDDVNC